ncbi:FHA domain-containing protein [Nocardioides sp. C4-1]|uniref:FHA domain-containing protein n=1 Tax=Nocardioides sp. C4-1 TaxID=3151851 RepID=UPI003263D4A2
MPTLVDADLSFALETDGEVAASGRLTGTGNRLRLDVADAGMFAGPDDAHVVRSLARALAARGIVVEVHSGDVHLITMGAVRAPWWQRRVTRTRRIRLRSVRGAWTSARSRATGQASVLPAREVLPPTTLWPLFPTFLRRGPRRPATTHDPARGGSPRLTLAKDHLWPGERPPVYWLVRSETVIGSDPACDIVLPGLAARHAVVRHDDDDEFSVEQWTEPTRLHGAVVEGRPRLRTGARLEVGEHVLVFSREEFADHGRPHGGRIGGELGHQLPQADTRKR